MIAFEVPHTDLNAVISMAHGILNILKYSKHTSNSSGIYCDSSNQLFSVVNGGVINLCLHMPHKKKSRYHASGDRAGQRTRTVHSIHCCPNLMLWLRTLRLKWPEATSCWNHTICHIEAELCSSPKRCGNTCCRKMK